MRSWKKVKRSGTFHRHLKKQRENFDENCALMRDEISKLYSGQASYSYTIAHINHNATATASPITENNCDENATDRDERAELTITTDDAEGNDINFHCNYDTDSDNDEISAEEDTMIKAGVFRNELKKWASDFKIAHLALNGLSTIVNSYVGHRIMPKCGRTLMQTQHSVIPVQVLAGGGEYWHNGLAKCLTNMLRELDHPISISLNINIDGLPLYNSSKMAFWPILFNIHEMPKIPPAVIGIYCGETKITDVETYFNNFVDEMLDVMAKGVHINSHKISVKIRCFICDSPARAFVKGMKYTLSVYSAY